MSIKINDKEFVISAISSMDAVKNGEIFPHTVRLTLIGSDTNFSQGHTVEYVKRKKTSDLHIVEVSSNGN